MVRGAPYLVLSARSCETEAKAMGAFDDVNGVVDCSGDLYAVGLHGASLHASPNGLFAHSEEAVWRYRQGQWHELTVDAFRHETGIIWEDYQDRQALKGITCIEGGLLVAATSGLYVMF